MLATAYSIVRGSREREDAPLDEFFKICAPLIEVIPPEEYQLLQSPVPGDLGKARARIRRRPSHELRLAPA
jgi:hypothetical protein